MIRSSMLLQCFGQPGIEVHFFSGWCANEIRLSAQQTFGRGETNKIFRGFDFLFEVFVFCFDVIDCFLRRMGLSVADESCV